MLTYAVSVTMRQGHPVLSLPLPSKRESCDFTLHPHLQNVGDLTQSIQAEDMGVDKYVSQLEGLGGQYLGLA